MKVLVAEDSAVMRLTLVHFLRDWDYEVVETKDGEEAWERFQAERFPLVLTDWMMPQLDGIDLVKRIRNVGSGGYTYIVLLTAKTDKADLVEAMEAGADDFLIKPCDPNELRVRVRAGERIIRLEQALEDQNRQLRETQAALVQSEKLASLGQLAAGMAHEVNNPISFVANNLSVLRREVGSVNELLAGYHSSMKVLREFRPDLVAESERLEREHDLEWIQESLPKLCESSIDGLSRVRDIVKNLRDFARLDEAELDKLDVNQALRSTADVLRHESDSRQVTVQLDCAQDLPNVNCFPVKIHQVFYSLLQNAIQASEIGGTIVVATRTDQDGRVVVEVIDHGEGIDPSVLPHIFDPFFTTKPVGSGTGLGLAVSFGVIRDHGGEIEVESELGHGSTFRVRLPLQPPKTDDG